MGLIDSCLVPCGSFLNSPISFAFEAETFFEQSFCLQNQYFVLQHLEKLSDVVVEGAGWKNLGRVKH